MSNEAELKLELDVLKLQRKLDRVIPQAIAEAIRTSRGGGGLQGLAEKWERSARMCFRSAELEKNEMGRRLIEHGAMTYFNCAQELRKALVDLEPQQ